MPAFLKYLCLLFGMLTLTKLVTLGLTVGNPEITDQFVVPAAVIASTGAILLLGGLVGFFKRRWNSLKLLSVAIPVIAVCDFAFFILGWVTPFGEAPRLLKFQQILDWLELITCCVLAVVLRFRTTKSWYVSKLR